MDVMERPAQSLIPLKLRPMTEHDAEAIAGWRYEPPYDFYNLPPWDKLKARRQFFADPSSRKEQYISICTSDDRLIGFAQFIPKGQALRLGLGMKPEITGQHLSAVFLDAVIREARRRAPWQELELYVVTWNKRAVKAYQRAGFIITKTLQRRIEGRYEPVYHMSYQPQPQRNHG